MLVITRKAQQTIKIGENVVIHVLRTQSGHVRLGIVAPQEVRIVRGELPPLEKEQGELKEAS